MRTVYHEKLSEVADQLGKLCGLAGAAMERATRGVDPLHAEPRLGGSK